MSYSRAASEAPREFAQVSGAMTGAWAIHKTLVEILAQLNRVSVRVPKHVDPIMEVEFMAAATVEAQTESLKLLEQLRAKLFPIT